MEYAFIVFIVICAILILVPEFVLFPLSELLAGALINRNTKRWMIAKGYHEVTVRRRIPHEIRCKINLLQAKWSWIRYVEYADPNGEKHRGYVIIKPFWLSRSSARRNLFRL